MHCIWWNKNVATTAGTGGVVEGNHFRLAPRTCGEGERRKQERGLGGKSFVIEMHADVVAFVSQLAVNDFREWDNVIGNEVRFLFSIGNGRFFTSNFVGMKLLWRFFPFYLSACLISDPVVHPNLFVAPLNFLRRRFMRFEKLVFGPFALTVSVSRSVSYLVRRPGRFAADISKCGPPKDGFDADASQSSGRYAVRVAFLANQR